jgi:hypothetical protein
MNKYIDSLKEFYQNKVKIRKSKTIPEIEIDKIPYYYDKDYLQFIENNILEEKSKILIAKYNVYYDLETEIDAYEEIEKNIKMLKEERDKIKFNIERKEETKMKYIKKLNDEIEGLKLNYSQLPEMIDKKIIYAEIASKREEINSILNNDRCIILKEVNKKKIYTLTTDYQPISGNEIFPGSTLETNESDLKLNQLEDLDNFGSEGFAESKEVKESKESREAKEVKEPKKKFTKLTFVSNQSTAEPKTDLRPKVKFNSNP